MTRKQFPHLAALLLLTLAASCCQSHPSRLLRQAESLALSRPDSAAALLAQTDTVSLGEADRAQLLLTRALIGEERWQRQHADTAVGLAADKENWSFYINECHENPDGNAAGSAEPLMPAYLYYERASLGGTSDDKEALSRFGRICYAMARQHDDHDTLLQADKLYHLAIHCAERADDHELAYRAYTLFGNHLNFSHSNRPIAQHHCYLQALHHFNHCRDNAQWLLMILNNYGRIFLTHAPFDLHSYPALVQAAEVPAHYLHTAMPATAYDSVYQRLDSIWSLPYEGFLEYMQASSTGKIDQDQRLCHFITESTVPINMYEEAKAQYESRDQHADKYVRQNFPQDLRNSIQSFNIERDTYLAPGYAMKASLLQKRLFTAVIILLVFAIFFLLMLFYIWRIHQQRKHQAEQAQREHEAERLALQLRQKDAMIDTLRGHIIDKSEILEILAPTAGRRTVINARNWREIEATLDSADDRFVSRLRATHPQFSEEDIRLCMLARLRLSNNALSAIYSISISAVQHRKQKLKKEGFGVTNPNTTLDQIINNF